MTVIRLGTGVFVAGLALLHVLQPDLDPRWRYPSEYALGEHGWLMTAAFLGLGVAFLAAARALAGFSHGRRLTRRAAQALLLIAGSGPFVAAVFQTDPITVPPEAATTTGTLHQTGASLSAAIPLAVLLVWLVLRRQPGWARIRLPVLSASLIALASSVAAAVVVAGYADSPHGPERLDGLALRVELASTSMWLLVLAGAVAHVGASPGPATLEASTRAVTS
jgi:hypothetical protein